MDKAYIIGTCDTKYAELAFIRDRLHEAGTLTQLLDVGIFTHDHPVDVSHWDIAEFHPKGPDFLDQPDDRGAAVMAMSVALKHFLLQQHDIGGVIGLGGSGGTSLICRALRALPIGLPKVMLSTVASGNVAPYVGASDIMMLYSVTDLAGINAISNQILSNAAFALAGMINHSAPDFKIQKPAVGLTMFGVTTPCINYIREQLEQQYDCLVFHATGTGGRSMEKLIESGYIRLVVDMTTTEICDLHMGGIMSAGEDRLGAIIRRKIPYIGSVGAIDMVNFGALATVPDRYKNRLLYQHNAEVTLMRTTPEENVKMGRWIAHKLNQCRAPVRFYLPEKGVSMLSVAGQLFYDPEADQALFNTLENEIHTTADRQLIRLPYSINDPAFAEAVVKGFREVYE